MLNIVNDLKRLCTHYLATTAARLAGGVPKCAPAVPGCIFNTVFEKIGVNLEEISLGLGNPRLKLDPYFTTHSCDTWSGGVL